MPMPGRQTVGSETYRYAYQGQEKDPETGKEAFQLRLWDARISRWLSPDPYGQYHSPYMGMGNNPMNGIDPDGGLFGKIRAKLYQFWHGGEVFKNDFDQWIWTSSEEYASTGNITDGFLLGETELGKNFGYGFLGKFTNTSNEYYASGETSFGFLNHGFNLFNTLQVEVKGNTILNSFTYGQKNDVEMDWYSINENYKTSPDYAKGELGLAVTALYGLAINTEYDTNHEGFKNTTVSGSASVVSVSVHKFDSKGIDFDFGLEAALGFRFFYGAEVKAGVSSGYSWRF